MIILTIKKVQRGFTKSADDDKLLAAAVFKVEVERDEWWESATLGYKNSWSQNLCSIKNYL